MRQKVAAMLLVFTSSSLLLSSIMIIVFHCVSISELNPFIRWAEVIIFGPTKVIVGGKS